jgi:hypothetical protein
MLSRRVLADFPTAGANKKNETARLTSPRSIGPKCYARDFLVTIQICTRKIPVRSGIDRVPLLLADSSKISLGERPGIRRWVVNSWRRGACLARIPLGKRERFTVIFVEEFFRRTRQVRRSGSPPRA